jgi:RNA polymerase sigma-70 factor (TIGR02960 family)
MTGETAYRERIEPHRAELRAHCYRMLGSAQDAEDALQEALTNAWRALPRFEGRSSVRSWLYTIATNRCLNALRARSRRPREVPAMADPLEPTRVIEPVWLEPYPDALLEGIPDRAPGPAARYEARESIELSFIVALQHLPPRQRAALVLADVLGLRTAEVAEMLGTGEASVKGALQRARATLRTRLPSADRERAPQPNSAGERQLVGRFADAMQSGDLDDMVALLTDDALLTMPPQPLEYQGHDAIAAFMRQRAQLRGAPLRFAPTRANTQPAFGCYLPDPHGAIAHPYGLFVLTLEGDAIAAITWFSDTGVFRHSGLPRTLPRVRPGFPPGSSAVPEPAPGQQADGGRRGP